MSNNYVLTVNKSYSIKCPENDGLFLLKVEEVSGKQASYSFSSTGSFNTQTLLKIQDMIRDVVSKPAMVVDLKVKSKRPQL